MPIPRRLLAVAAGAAVALSPVVGASLPASAETVSVAGKYEAQHAERVAVLQSKLAAQQAEIELAARITTRREQQLGAPGGGFHVVRIELDVAAGEPCEAK